MSSNHRISYVLCLLIIALLGLAGFASAFTLKAAMPDPQTHSATRRARRMPMRAERRKLRRTRANKAISLNSNNDALMARIGIGNNGDEQRPSDSAEDKTPLAETLDYIQQRITEYGKQVGYSGASEVVKEVTFTNCAPPSDTARNTIFTARPTSVERTLLSPPAQCSRSWTVTFKDGSPGGADVTRTTIVKLKDLNLESTGLRQGVIWVRTDPYRSIAITTPGVITPLMEDEWWIDLHDDDVALRVTRALKHAAGLCRASSYVEPFSK
jgi:hypothetical protein